MFHALTLQPDLFGGCTLNHEAGKNGQAGKVVQCPYDTTDEALAAAMAIASHARNRGYR